MSHSPIAREGIYFISLSLAVSILLFIIGFSILASLTFLVSLFFLFFFRNPRRYSKEQAGTLLVPADGKVLDIRELDEKEFIGQKLLRVSIFMSPLNVHVNRTPCNGIVKRVEHRDGEFALAFKKDIDKENERNFILVEHQGESFLIVQIAGFLARRITSYVREGDRVERGDPIGIIAFGSRVDIYLPEEYDILVRENEKVKAGVTPLAKRRGHYEAA